MTRLLDISLRNVRSLEQVSMLPGPSLNLVGGSNGAGKTSLLEALYLAARGRSFRHPDVGPLIRFGNDEAQVVLRLESASAENRGVLGIRRSRTEFECRFNGESVHRRSSLAEILPLLFMSSVPQTLLSVGPDVRRRFLDMAMFHVEPGYLRRFSDWQRSLRQRNAALSAHDPAALVSWDAGFLRACAPITDGRRFVLGKLADHLLAVVERELDLGIPLELRYRPGWPMGESPDDALQRRRETDMERGFTSVGPQRGDLVVTTRGQPVDKALSRGQLKLLVFALNLALVDTVRQERDRGFSPVFLMDDLGAELDVPNQRRVLASLYGRRLQSFVALLDPSLVADPDRDDRVFHVEQGHVS